MVDYSDNFNKCLHNAKIFENHIADIFWTTPNNTTEKEFDIEAFIECKDDIMSLDTGNIAFEYRYKWNPSWISLWNNCICYNAFGSVYLCSKKVIRERIKNNKNKCRFVKWWDWKMSSLCLIKKQDFISVFYELKKPNL